MNNTVEVMFWRENDTAICFGYTSKFQFDSREDAERFVEQIDIPDCKWVSFQDDSGIEYHEVYEDVDTDEDYGCTCDIAGICGGPSCPQYYSCHA